MISAHQKQSPQCAGRPGTNDMPQVRLSRGRSNALPLRLCGIEALAMAIEEEVLQLGHGNLARAIGAIGAIGAVGPSRLKLPRHFALGNASALPDMFRETNSDELGLWPTEVPNATAASCCPG